MLSAPIVVDDSEAKFKARVLGRFRGRTVRCDQEHLASQQCVLHIRVDAVLAWGVSADRVRSVAGSSRAFDADNKPFQRFSWFRSLDVLVARLRIDRM